VECFHFDDTMNYIDPDVCIDCGGCIPACPVNAIYDSYNLPEEEMRWEAINQERSKELPVLSAPIDPLPGADEKKRELGL
jgi:ferredoxin